MRPFWLKKKENVNESEPEKPECDENEPKQAKEPILVKPEEPEVTQADLVHHSDVAEDARERIVEEFVFSVPSNYCGEEWPSTTVSHGCPDCSEQFLELAPPRRKSIVRVTAPDELTMTADINNFRNRVYPSHDMKINPIASNIYPKIGDLPGTILYDNTTLTKERDEDGYPYIKKNPEFEKANFATTRYFRDDERNIDFILVYQDGSKRDQRRRKVFHKHLIDEGLELEIEDKKESEAGENYYVKIHAPWDLLTRYAEILKLKKPIKKEAPTWRKPDIFQRFGMKNPFNYNEELIPPEPQVFSAGFSMHRQEISKSPVVSLTSDSEVDSYHFSEGLPADCTPKERQRRASEWFLIKERDLFFTQAQRNLITWEVLKRVRYSAKDLGFGISRLLANNTYLAAFPLHDGPYDKDLPDGKMCDRRLLYLEWARGAKWYKKQPLHLVRRYFGDKMALYFAWLGFYTQMLVPAAIMGVFTFVCGLFFMNSDFNKPSEEICDVMQAGNLTMCPLCDEACHFKRLSDSCMNSKVAFLFDNPMTVVFSIGMSFWATMFLELWKRKQVVIQWQWDMENYEDDEELRPQYEEAVTEMKINPVTKKKEPYLPFWNKLGRCVAANSVVLLMLLLVIAAVMGVILYRLVVGAVMYKTDSPIVNRHAKLVTSATAATINLIVIMVLNYIYEKIVLFLTTLEMPRTQTEYEDSFTIKMFLFQFINFYSSLIYIAFFKGRFFYHPGDTEARDNFWLKLRYDMCDPAGCLFELCVQLAIIMVGKQFFSNCIELFIPFFKIWWNKRSHKESSSEIYTRWEQDYDLAEYTRLSLFYEYLEMVIQYGFITLFVAAFPLAPLFALINNVVEIRLDAYKYLTKCRRSLPQRVQDIGIWYNILKAVTYISVLTNALVISYTSDFIPRLVYMFAYSKEFNLEGYITNTLSIFNVSEYKEGYGPSRELYGDQPWPTSCYYIAYRNPPNDTEKYELNLQFWHVFTARLAFILIFEHIIFMLTGIMAWAIPDIPVEVKNQILMEKKVEKETLFEAELKKIKEERQLKLQSLFGASGPHFDLGDGYRIEPSPCCSSSSSRPPSRNSGHGEVTVHDADT